MCLLAKIFLAAGVGLATIATYQTGPIWTVVLTMAALGIWGMGTYHVGQHHGAELVRTDMARELDKMIKEARSRNEIRQHINDVTGRSSQN